MADGDLWRDRNKVFVAGIPATWDDAMLAQKFRPFGEMFQSKVVYDAKTGKSKGFGFITFSEYVHALEAVSAMNQTKWENRILNVRFLQPKAEKTGGSDAGAAGAAPSAVQQPARRPTKVFGPAPEGCTSVYVGNLAYDITDKVLRKVFATCGDIKAVRLAAHIETKEFRGFGYVQFYDSAACEKAVQQDGMVVMGRPMNLDYGARDEVVEKAREDLSKKLKKGVCHKFQSGQCPRGDECKFAHVLSAGTSGTSGTGGEVAVVVAAEEEEEEDDGGIPICQSFLKGKCKRGESCKFRHVEPSATPAIAIAATTATPVVYRQPAAYVDVPVVEEDATPVCQNYLKGKCTRGDKCRFRHSDESATVAAAVPAPAPVPVRAPAFERSRYAPPAAAPEARVPRATSRVAAPVEEIPICQNFQKGTCKRGDSCRFRHVEAAATPVAPATEELPSVPAPVSAPVAAAATVDPAPIVAPVGPPGEPTAADDDAPICQNYLKTKCKRGAACRFRHVDPSSIPVVEVAPPLAIPAVVPTISICRNYQRGRCMRGTSCRFAHTDGDVAMEEQTAAPVVTTTSTYDASVANAHSEYQKRFQSVCYNWQNARSCVRGDQCPFYHDGAAAVAAVAAQPKSSRKETTPEEEETVKEEEEDDEEMDQEKTKKVKKEKKEKKEKKSKKDKKRKAAESDSDSDSDEEATKKKKKKHKKHKE